MSHHPAIQIGNNSNTNSNNGTPSSSSASVHSSVAFGTPTNNQHPPSTSSSQQYLNSHHNDPNRRHSFENGSLSGYNEMQHYIHHRTASVIPFQQPNSPIQYTKFNSPSNNNQQQQQQQSPRVITSTNFGSPTTSLFSSPSSVTTPRNSLNFTSSAGTPNNPSHLSGGNATSTATAGGDSDDIMLLMMDPTFLNGITHTSNNLRSSLTYVKDQTKNAPKSLFIQNIIHDLVEELTSIIKKDNIILNNQHHSSMNIIYNHLTSMSGSDSSSSNLTSNTLGVGGMGGFAGGNNSTSINSFSGNLNTFQSFIGSASTLISNNSQLLNNEYVLYDNALNNDNTKHSNIYFKNSYSLKLLFKYHNDKNSKIFIYKEILKRMQENEDSVSILLVCLYLLKTFLTTFKRDDSLLDQYKNIYYYCKDGLSKKHLNANLQTQLQFCIKYLHRHLIKILQKNQTLILNMLNYDKRISGLTSRVFEYYLYKNRLLNNDILNNNYSLNEKSTSFTSLGGASIGGDSKNEIDQTIMDFIYFGSQFRKFTKFEDKQAEIDKSNKILNIENMDTIKHQIQSIKSEIQHEEFILNNIDEILLPNLSQYIEQYYEYKNNNDLYIQSIIENYDQFNTILNQIINSNGDEIKLNDACLFFTVMISHTIYGNDQSKLTMKQLNSFFLEMLDTNENTNIYYVFKLIFNIYYYVTNLFNLYQNIPNIEFVISDLFSKFCDMSLVYFTMNDNDLFIKAKMSDILIYFLYHHFIIYNTNINLNNNIIIELNPQLLIDQLDVRIVFDLILYNLSNFNEEYNSYDILISLLTFQINQQNNLIKKLPNTIFSIIQLYTEYNHLLNLNSKYNLFLIIFDYIINLELPDMESFQKDYLFLLFDQSNLPLYLHLLFKFIPNVDKHYTFVKLFTKFLYTNFVKSETFFFKIDNLMKFIIGLQKLSCKYLNSEFKNYTTNILNNMNMSNINLFEKIIKDLIFNCTDANANANSTTGTTSTSGGAATSTIGSSSVGGGGSIGGNNNNSFNGATSNGSASGTGVGSSTSNSSTFMENSDDDLRQGELILFNFIKFFEDYDNLTPKYYQDLKLKMNQLMTDMINHESPKIRILYLNLLEKKIQLFKSKCTTHGDLVKVMIKNINESLLECIVNRKETNLHILIKSFYIVFDFISIVNSLQSSLKSSNELYNLDMCEMFLSGYLTIPFYLLKDISISILYYLFESLHSNQQQSSQLSSICSVLLILIIEKCNKSVNVLESIGGITFFKNLLQQEKFNPTILYYTSKYLMKQLSQSFPSEYYNYLSNLILKAQSENLPNLLQNPYNPFFI